MSKNQSAKNSLVIGIAILAVMVLIFSINYGRTKKNGIVEIREKMFATQVSDVYLNAKDYLGKTIKLEGIFKSEQYKEDQEPFCFVVRYGPGGCCGFDANVGFEVKWDKNRAQQYPAAESWVEATGELKVYEDGDYLYIDLASLNVLSRRGAETVVQ
ncbi:MAG: hypothetical protein FWG29_06635 [Treponema sp.]|nr:hypothetical protein [Treponema sp.]